MTFVVRVGLAFAIHRASARTTSSSIRRLYQETRSATIMLIASAHVQRSSGSDGERQEKSWPRWRWLSPQGQAV
jgi:hypothetical protein